MKARCPNNRDHFVFITCATVLEDWVVDGFGGFIEEAPGGSIVVHGPNVGNLWTCKECGVEAIVER